MHAPCPTIPPMAHLVHKLYYSMLALRQSPPSFWLTTTCELKLPIFCQGWTCCITCAFTLLPPGTS